MSSCPENFLSESEIRNRLPGFDVRLYDILGSTNDEAKRLIETGSMAAPGLVIANAQTAGRGRPGHSWWSAPGALTCSFVLELPAKSVPLAGFAASLAARQAVADATGIAAQLKWPNDVLLTGRKVAGILCETAIACVVVGVGANVNNSTRNAPGDLSQTAVAISDVNPGPTSISDLARQIASGLVTWLDRMRTDYPWHTKYDRHHVLHGKHVTLAAGQRLHQGTCRGINPAGQLLLNLAGTIRPFSSGHVTY